MVYNISVICISVCCDMVCSLTQLYGGKVSRLVEAGDRDAMKLARLLASSFPCFRDEASHRGTSVVFLKRAQIFVSDLWNRFGGRGYGEFWNIEDLTMFADYRWGNITRTPLIKSSCSPLNSRTYFVLVLILIRLFAVCPGYHRASSILGYSTTPTS